MSDSAISMSKQNYVLVIGPLTSISNNIIIQFNYKIIIDTEGPMLHTFGKKVLHIVPSINAHNYL